MSSKLIKVLRGKQDISLYRTYLEQKREDVMALSLMEDVLRVAAKKRMEEEPLWRTFCHDPLTPATMERFVQKQRVIVNGRPLALLLNFTGKQSFLEHIEAIVKRMPDSKYQSLSLLSEAAIRFVFDMKFGYLAFSEQASMSLYVKAFGKHAAAAHAILIKQNCCSSEVLALFNDQTALSEMEVLMKNGDAIAAFLRQRKEKIFERALQAKAWVKQLEKNGMKRGDIAAALNLREQMLFFELRGNAGGSDPHAISEERFEKHVEKLLKLVEERGLVSNACAALQTEAPAPDQEEKFALVPLSALPVLSLPAEVPKEAEELGSKETEHVEIPKTAAEPPAQKQEPLTNVLSAEDFRALAFEPSSEDLDCVRRQIISLRGQLNVLAGTRKTYVRGLIEQRLGRELEELVTSIGAVVAPDSDFAKSLARAADEKRKGQFDLFGHKNRKGEKK